MKRLTDRHLDETTLHLLALDPSADRRGAAHLATCGRCQAASERAQRAATALRSETTAAADAVFSAADLERQRRSILARIGRSQRTARVLAFPAAEAAAPRPRADRRWLAAAVAAGLVLGVLAGQLPHLVRTAPSSGTVADRQVPAAPAVEDVRAGSRPVDDTLLSEVEAALAPGSRPELRALDALTPVHYEMR